MERVKRIPVIFGLAVTLCFLRMVGLGIFGAGSASEALEYPGPSEIDGQNVAEGASYFEPIAAIDGTTVTFEVSFSLDPDEYCPTEPHGLAVEDIYVSIVTICPWDPLPPPEDLTTNYETHCMVNSWIELPSGDFYFKPSWTHFENKPDGNPDRILSNTGLTYFGPPFNGYPSYKMTLVEGEPWQAPPPDQKWYVSEGKFKVTVEDWPVNIFDTYDIRWVLFGRIYLKCLNFSTLTMRPYHLPNDNPEYPGWTIPIGMPPVLTIDIDIKPGSDPNCFNQNEHGVIPVAVLGSADLDVYDINVDSLSLQGLAVRMAGKSNKYLAHYEYVDEDDYLDLIVKFEDSDSWIDPGISGATLTGQLYDGTFITGTDTICIVP